jgi:hypothetical protein
MRQRHGLAGTGAGDDEQRSGVERRAVPAFTEGCRFALRRVQFIQVFARTLARLHHGLPKSVFLYSTGFIYKATLHGR